jgi:hypothetical protein
MADPESKGFDIFAGSQGFLPAVFQNALDRAG